MTKRGLPVRIQTRKLALGIVSKRYVCDGDRVAGVELQNRRDPRKTVVVHPSTKFPGKWQSSYLDHRGASSDTQRDSCTAAMDDLPPNQWRLRTVSRRK
jgi:hypothetical protein